MDWSIRVGARDSGQESAAGEVDDGGFAADLVRSMRCGLITVDCAGRIRSLNDPARQMLELESSVGEGDEISGALASHPHLARLLSDAPGMTTLPDRAETEIRTRDRRGRTLGFTLSRVVGLDGEVRGVALFFKDLTPIERELERERLKENLAALGTMAASLAHEIRNPLTALELSATLLLRTLDADSPAVEQARTLQEQVRRLSEIADISLEYIRPLDLRLRPADLAHLLDAAVEEALAAAPQATIAVVRRYPGKEHKVPVDAARLRLALVNLVRNAVEAMDGKGGELLLTLEEPRGPEDEAFAHIAISDTGVGIPDEIRPKIFNPFFSTKSSGSGLGLAWTRKVVDAHGGLLDVESDPDRGTVFHVRLPLRPAIDAGLSAHTGDSQS